MAPVTSMRLQDASHGQRDDVLRRLPLVARGRGPARVHRARAPPRRSRSPRSASSPPAPARRRSEVFGQYLGTGAAATRAINRLLEPGASLTKNEHTYVAGAADLRRLPRQDGGAVPSPRAGAGRSPAPPSPPARPTSPGRSEPPARASVIDVIEARQAAGGSGVLLFDAQGGAIDDVAAEPVGLHPPSHAQLGADPELLRRRLAASRARAPSWPPPAARWPRSRPPRPTRTTPTPT